MKQEKDDIVRALPAHPGTAYNHDSDIILDNVQEAILMIDEIGLVQFANESAQKLLNIKRSDQMVGEHYATVLHLQDADGNPLPPKKQPWHLVIESGKNFTNKPSEPYYIATDPTRRLPVMLRVTPLYRRRRLVGGSIIFPELKARATEEAPIDFISLASHQLRTPLTVANLHVDMLLAGHMGALTDEQRKVIEEISFYHQKMNQVLVEFLVASRVEMGTFMIDKKPLDIMAKVQEVVRELEPEIKHKKAKVLTEFESVPQAVADSQVVRIVTYNVLSNAIKFSPVDSVITVAVTAKRGQIVISIKDNGQGIPAPDQAKIFDKMFRGDNSINNRTSGVGFGLYIVKSLLDLCDGKIWFTSEENKGTTFFMSFPIKEEKTKS